MEWRSMMRAIWALLIVFSVTHGQEIPQNGKHLTELLQLRQEIRSFCGLPSLNQSECEWSAKSQRSAKQVIESSGGGSSCRGVFLSRQEDRMEKKRYIGIMPIDSLNLLWAVGEQTSDERQFENAVSKKNYLHKLNNFGMRIAADANFQYGLTDSISVNAGLDLKKDEEHSNEQKTTENRMQSSAIKVMHVPIGSVDLIPFNIRLNQDVLNELIKIENKLEHKYEEKTQLFRDFFEKYGSHIMTGLIEFGGHIILTSEASSVDSSEFSHVKDAVRSSLDAYAGVSFSYGLASGEASVQTSAYEFRNRISTSYEAETLKNIKLSMTKKGGPAAEDDFKKWREGLERNIETWSIIEKPNELTPLWSLIEEHHNDSFKDAKKIATEMAQEWTQIENKDYEEEMGRLPKAFNSLGISQETADKRRELLLDVLRERNVGAKRLNKVARFSIIPGGTKLLMSALQVAPIDPDRTMLEFDNVQHINEHPYKVYFKLSYHDQYLGHIIIKLDGYRSYPRAVQHFVSLASGANEQGVSYTNASFWNIGSHGAPGEYIPCNGYLDGHGQLQRASIHPVEGNVPGTAAVLGEVRKYKNNDGQNSGFYIITRSGDRFTSPVIGHVTSGIAILKAAAAKGGAYVGSIRFEEVGLVILE